MKLNPVLKFVVALIGPLGTSLDQVYGHGSPAATIAAAVAAALVFLVPNTPNPPKPPAA